jgi:hypothetical protein
MVRDIETLSSSSAARPAILDARQAIAIDACRSLGAGPAAQYSGVIRGYGTEYEKRDK